MNSTKVYFLLLLLASLLSGCGLPSSPTVANTPAPSKTETIVQSPAATALPSSTPRPSETPTVPPTATTTVTSSPTPVATPSATPVPTYIKIRGEVIVAQAVCHYGPGAPYLYKYGLVQGSNLEIIGQLVGGADPYLEVQAIGGNNPCWVNARWMKVKGDLANVQPIRAEDVRLPMSPYYGPIQTVSASRAGDQVTVSWSPISLKLGDGSEQYPYLVEAWVCRGGQLVFIPVGSYPNTITIQDEDGCSLPSHGRVYAVEKHGYTRWLEIPWPPAE